MSDLASRITDPNKGATEAPAAPAADAPVDAPVAAPEAALDAASDEAPKDVPATDTDQVDGTVENLGGSGLEEPEWDVEVSLSDLQNMEATPFHSATTWQDLGLYALQSTLIQIFS